MKVNSFGIEPNVKSYATAENAIRAVEKRCENLEEFQGGKAFNVLVVYNAEGRAVPMLVNVHKDFFHIAIHLGFMVVN